MGIEAKSSPIIDAVYATLTQGGPFRLVPYDALLQYACNEDSLRAHVSLARKKLSPDEQFYGTSGGYVYADVPLSPGDIVRVKGLRPVPGRWAGERPERALKLRSLIYDIQVGTVSRMKTIQPVITDAQYKLLLSFMQGYIYDFRIPFSEIELCAEHDAAESLLHRLRSELETATRNSWVIHQVRRLGPYFLQPNGH